MNSIPPVRATERVKLIIFDLDGTLADTVPSITEGVNLALSEAGYPLRDEDYVRRAVGDGARMLCRRVIPSDKTDDGSVDALLHIYNRTYGLVHLHVKEPYEGIRDAVETLTERGYSLAVFSNKQEPYVKGIISSLFPRGEFSAVLGAMPGRAMKPDPAGALEICRLLGMTSDDAAMVGDGETDIMLARACGMKQVSVTWGFRTADFLVSSGATLCADTPSDLCRIFTGIRKQK